MGTVILDMVWHNYGMSTVDTYYAIHNDSVYRNLK